MTVEKTENSLYNIPKSNGEVKPLGGTGYFRLVPVITIILNFSRTRWNKARSLKELVPAGYPVFTDHMKDYNVEIFDVLYLDETIRSRFTSDFRDVVTVLAEGKIDKKHNFRKLKYPIDALDMIYAYTKDERYRNIRNKIIKKEMNGEVVSMREFLDELEKNKTIEIARKMYQDDKNTAIAISIIKHGLDLSTEEAQEIFDTEVLGVALI